MPTPLYVPAPPRKAPSDEEVLDKISAQQEEAGARNPYQRLAQYYGVEENHPKLYQLAGKLLAKGIDPNEWLDSKIGGDEPPVHAMTPVDPRGMRTSVEPPATEPEMQEPGPIRRYMVHRSHMYEPAQMAAETRQLARGADRALFNVPTKIARSMGRTMEPMEADDEERAAYMRPVGQIGATLPMAGLAGRALMPFAGPAVGAAANYGRAAGAAAGAGMAMAGVPVVGGALEAGQALSDTASGEERLSNVPRRAWEGAKQSLTPPNLLLAAALGAGGGYAQGLRRGNTQTGEDIRLREEFGGRPSLTQGAKGGAFDQPGIAGKRGTSAEVADLGRDSSAKVLGRLQERRQQNSADYARREAEYLRTPAASQPVDLTDEINSAQRAIATNPELPAGVRQAASSTLLREFLDDDLVKPMWQGGRLMATPKQLNQLRKRWDSIAKTGQPGEDEIYRGVAERLRELENQTGYRDIKAPFAEETENIKRGHELLGVGNKAKIRTGDIKAEKRGARAIRRTGENTATGGLEQRDMAEFNERFPELRDTIAAPKLLAAKNRLSFGVPEGGTLYSRLQGLATRNLEPLEANVLGPMGDRVGQAAPMAGAGNPILRAYMEYQRRQEEMSNLLRSGGRR